MNNFSDFRKQALGEIGASLIQEGMIVGLGTGSTARCFINSLIKRCKEGLKIKVVATSQTSAIMAQEGGLKLIDINEAIHLDMTVDGADEVDSKKRMIKGGGGALLWEKIVAASSREMVVLIEEKKLVQQLGAFPLPVEIIPFGYKATLDKLANRGYGSKIRKSPANDFFITDSGHYIADIFFDRAIDNPEQVDEDIRQIPGVVDTGFFLDRAGRVLVALNSGEIVTI